MNESKPAKRNAATPVVAAAFACLLSAAAVAQEADLVLRNGVIWTVDDDNPPPVNPPPVNPPEGR